MRALGAGAAVATAAVLLLAGCAQGQGARAGGDAAGAPTSSAPAATSPPTSPLPTTPPTSSGPTLPPTSTSPGRMATSTAPGRTATTLAGTLVVRGTLRQGVEPGCLLLDTQDRHAYLLVDIDPAKARPGARVEVVGQPLDQIASFCGEGTALSVVSVRALG
jgi:hypothetical protein